MAELGNLGSMRWLLVLWFGETAPGRKARDFVFVALPLFLADLITKSLALRFLEKHPVSLFSGGVQLLLHVNETLFSHGRTPSRAGVSDAVAFWLVMSVGLCAVACFPFTRAQWSIPRKLLLMVAVLVAGYTAGVVLGHVLEWEPQRLVLHAMRAFSSTALLLLGLRLTRSRYLGLVLSLAMAGGLGNAINVVYYPRGIIDFIYVPSFSPHLGVFNLADVAIEIAEGLLLLSPLVLLLAARMRRRNPLLQERLEYVPSVALTAPVPEPKKE